MKSSCSRRARRCICTAITLALLTPWHAIAQVQSQDRGSTGNRTGYSQTGDGKTSADTTSLVQAVTTGKAVASQLTTVIVTADKRSERLQDVPMAVSALSDTQLEREHASSFSDYATQIPGLNTISSGEGWTQLVMRGITSGSSEANPTVGTYIDDTPFGSSTVYAAGSVLTPDIDPNDLQRIEVLNGPQGTLYGSNTLGGLIKFVTTPPDTTQASARAGIGFSNVAGGGSGLDTHAMVNIPLVANTLALRVNLYDRDDPGYINNITTGKSNINKAKVGGARAQLLWTPRDKVSVRFSTLAQNLTSNGLANSGIDVDSTTLQPLYGKFDQARAAGTGMFKVKYRIYDLSVNADFGWAKLVSNTSYSTLRFNENTDLTDAYGPLLNPLLGLSDGGYSELQRVALNKVTQELRLQSPEDQTWEWRAGLFYTREHTIDNEDILGFNADTGAPYALPALGDVSVGPAVFTEWAAYGDLTWHLNSRLSMLVGARYSKDRTSYSQTGSGLLLGASDFTTRSSNSPFTFLVNPSYKFSDNEMFYLRVASAYRPGGPNVGVPPGLSAPLSFGPDKLVSYEMGQKSLLLNQRMSIDADVFYVDWRKVQLTTTNGGISFLGNGGKATSRGAEISWRYNMIGGLTLWANATYTNAKLAANAPSGSIYGLKGAALPYVPKWNANLGLDYDFPLGGNGWSGFAGGNLSRVGARESDFNTDTTPRIRLPAYTDIDLHAGLNYADWTFELYAKNVANRRGINMVAAEAISAASNPYLVTYQTPRTIGVSASVSF